MEVGTIDEVDIQSAQPATIRTIWLGEKYTPGLQRRLFLGLGNYPHAGISHCPYQVKLINIMFSITTGYVKAMRATGRYHQYNDV